MTYPNSSGFEAHSATSAKSAALLDSSGNAANYDSIILNRLEALGPQGAMVEEIRKFMNADFPHLHNGTVNGRLSTLWRRDLILKTTMERQTEAKRPAAVYVHPKYRDCVQVAAPYAKAVGPDASAEKELAKMFWQLVQAGAVELSPLEMSIAENLAKRAGLV